MVASVLVDTGALLALLDENDEWSRTCTAAVRQLRLPLATSEAVLTELFYLAGSNSYRMEEAWTLVRSGMLVLLPIDHSELPAMHALMSRYADRLMDFADATLVYLAQREGISTVFTVDHADFETYRIDGRRRFRIIPARRP